MRYRSTITSKEQGVSSPNQQFTITSKEQRVCVVQTTGSPLLRPAEVLARHLVELLIERSEEVPQPL